MPHAQFRGRPFCARFAAPSMPTAVALHVLTTMVLAFSGAPAAFGQSDPMTDAPHADATLIASATQLAPGQPFELGVRLRMNGQSHVYWKNPGDSGMATEIEFKLPKGFSVGALQWPTPAVIRDGGMATFGYENEVLLWASVTPPKDLPSGPVTLTVHASWLVCKDACVPGEAELEWAGTVGEAATPSAEAAEFAEWRRRLPVAETEAPRRVTSVVAISAGPRAGTKTLTLTMSLADAPAHAEWLAVPVAPLALTVEAVTLDAAAKTLTVKAELIENGQALPPSLEALVILTDAQGQSRGYSQLLELKAK